MSIKIFGALIAAASFASCSGSKASDTSELREDSSPVSTSNLSNSCNLAITAAQSNEAVRGQLQCLQSIGESVGGWAGTAAAALGIVRDFSEQADELSDESPTSSETPQEGESPIPNGNQDGNQNSDVPEQQSPTSPEAIALTSSEVRTLAALLSAIASQSGSLPRWAAPCVASVRESASAIKSAYDQLSGFDTAQLTIESVTSLVRGLGEAVTGATRAAEAFNRCGRRGTAVANRLRRISERIAGLTSALGPVSAIARCAVNITGGVITLAHNTSCLMSDLAAIRSGWDAIQRQLDRPVLPDTSTSCDEWRRNAPLSIGMRSAQLCAIRTNSSCQVCCESDVGVQIRDGQETRQCLLSDAERRNTNEICTARCTERR